MVTERGESGESDRERRAPFFCRLCLEAIAAVSLAPLDRWVGGAIGRRRGCRRTTARGLGSHGAVRVVGEGARARRP